MPPATHCRERKKRQPFAGLAHVAHSIKVYRNLAYHVAIALQLATEQGPEQYQPATHERQRCPAAAPMAATQEEAQHGALAQ